MPGIFTSTPSGKARRQDMSRDDSEDPRERRRPNKSFPRERPLLKRSQDVDKGPSEGPCRDRSVVSGRFAARSIVARQPGGHPAIGPADDVHRLRNKASLLPAITT